MQFILMEVAIWALLFPCGDVCSLSQWPLCGGLKLQLISLSHCLSLLKTFNLMEVLAESLQHYKTDSNPNNWNTILPIASHKIWRKPDKPIAVTKLSPYVIPVSSKQTQQKQFWDRPFLLPPPARAVFSLFITLFLLALLSSRRTT